MSVVNVVRCAANAAVAAKVKTVATNDESELDFLQEKPSVGRKTGSKARRHAYLKFMIKQGKSDLFMEKELVNDSKLSKKRRGKVLSSLNDDFDLSVPYSINRKGRWENVNSAADLVVAANESDDVLVTGADGRYGMSWFTNGDATGYHELAADGTVRSKYSKGVSGTSLASLKASLTPCESRKSRRRSKRLAFAKIVPEDEVKSQEDEVKPQIRYVISKPHTVPMCYGGSMYKKDPYDDWSRSRHNNKKIDLEDADCRCDDVEQEDPEVDMTASMAALYRAPKQSTFSLGDFIKDSPAVLISSKSIESIADFEKTEPVDDLKKEMPSCSTNAVVDEQKLCKNAVFLEVEVEKAMFCGNGPLVGTFGTLESQKELRFRWLTDDKTRCCFDLTKKLDEHTTKMALMVVIEELKSKEGYLRVLLNGSFGCPEGVMINLLKEKSYTGAEAFIGLFVEKVQTWYNKTQESKKQLNSLATLNSIFHGHQLAKTVQPSGDYQILAEAAAKAPTVEAIMVDVEEDDDDMDFDEFEVVELDELISEGDEDEKEETADDLEILPDFGAGCDFCDTQNVDELVMLENCGHRFCKRCLRHELTDAIVRNTAYPLTCLHDTCHAAIPLDFLATILPLPLAEYYFRFAFMAENVANGKTVVECPHCKDLAAVDEKPTYGSVKCSVCSISFCFGCQSQPHFPLTCRQMAVWENKFAKQFPVDLGRKNVNGNKQCGCGELLQNEKNQTNVTCSACNVSYIWKTGEPIGRRANKAKPLIAVDLESLPNNIASEFSQICSEARLLRFNLVANRQITKKMCKSVDFRVKQVFIEIRKTVLHLIEFGFAWLYLTRNNKPAIWSSCKSGLTGLRAKLDIIHADIERGQSDGVEAKVAELNGMTQKILEEFADRG